MFAYMHVCTPCVQYLKGPEGVSELLKLELETVVVNHHVGAGY